MLTHLWLTLRKSSSVGLWTCSHSTIVRSLNDPASPWPLTWILRSVSDSITSSTSPTRTTKVIKRSCPVIRTASLSTLSALTILYHHIISYHIISSSFIVNYPRLQSPPGAQNVTSLVTWPFDSHTPLPIGAPLEMSLSPAVFNILGLSCALYIFTYLLTYLLKIFWSRPWPFRVTWHHWSHDHSIQFRLLTKTDIYTECRSISNTMEMKQI